MSKVPRPALTSFAENWPSPPQTNLISHLSVAAELIDETSTPAEMVQKQNQDVCKAPMFTSPLIDQMS